MRGSVLLLALAACSIDPSVAAPNVSAKICLLVTPIVGGVKVSIVECDAGSSVVVMLDAEHSYPQDTNVEGGE
jgi:hypothetical protein